MSVPSTFDPPLGSNCDLDHSPFHNLDCGHVVFSPSSDSNNKSACSPNCVRSVFFQKPNLPITSFRNTSGLPFVCPECVKDCIRYDYNTMLREHRAEGDRLANEKEADVKLWTYREILGIVDKGFRMCQGISGLLKTNDAAAYQALIASGEALIASGWSEGVPHTVPGLEVFTFRDMRDGRGDGTPLSSNDVDIDTEDASHVALLRAGYRDRAVQQLQQHDKLDQLVEQLGDVKVSARKEDVEMMDLTTKLGGL